MNGKCEKLAVNFAISMDFKIHLVAQKIHLTAVSQLEASWGQWKTTGKRENTTKNEWENQKTLAKTLKREERENTIKNEWEMRKNDPNWKSLSRACKSCGTASRENANRLSRRAHRRRTRALFESDGIACAALFLRSLMKSRTTQGRNAD